mgnify:CR=1 FL=1
MQKIFSSLGISHIEHHTFAAHGIFSEPVAAAEADTLGCTLLISSTTNRNDHDIIEWIIGTAEQRVVCNAAKTPVLFLNPRDDLYVLCD